jgi:hypothetical protein
MTISRIETTIPIYKPKSISNTTTAMNVINQASFKIRVTRLFFF